MLSFFLSSAVAAPEISKQPNLLVQVFPFLVVMLIFYFVIILPQQKQYKKTQEVLDALKVGDNVSTNSGLLGVISKIDNDKKLVSIKVDNNVNLTFYKSSISGVIEKEGSIEMKKPEKTKK